MLPTVVIVGRTNVGKSTLFNRLTRTRQSIVADQPGITRDRQYGYCLQALSPFIVIDTGGMEEPLSNNLDILVRRQCQQAIAEADLLLFLVDGHSELTSTDEKIAQRLRRIQKPVLVLVNKVDRMNATTATFEYYRLGFRSVFPISALRGRGLQPLYSTIFQMLSFKDYREECINSDRNIRLAIIGRPNVGKSTLVNALLNQERVIVSNQPGTTRDCLSIPLEYQGVSYVLLDTAGIRRHSKITDKIEKFSIAKTLQGIQSSQVVLFLMDAQEGVTDQDLHLLGLVLNAGKSLVLAINKWDRLSQIEQVRFKEMMDRKLAFIDFSECHFISALKKQGIFQIFSSVRTAYQNATQKLSTPQLTRILQQLVDHHAPPFRKGRRVKLRYAHAGGYNPPIIVIHGNQLKELPLSYRNYLKHGFRQALQLRGTPIQLEFKTGKNPYVPD